MMQTIVSTIVISWHFDVDQSIYLIDLLLQLLCMLLGNLALYCEPHC